MQGPKIVPSTKRFAKKLIKWGLRLFIWGIGSTILTLLAVLGGASFGFWSVRQAGIAVELAAAVSCTFGFAPMLTGCCLLVGASLLETFIEMRDSRTKTG